MKRLVALTLMILFINGCSGVREWTRDDLTVWYTNYNIGPLFYRGSDNHYHYFICRPVDWFVNIKVKRNQIEIDEVKPVIIGISGKPFPGYYVVDPNDNYNRIDTSPK